MLVGPRDDGAPQAFGQWSSPAVQTIWEGAAQMAREGDKLFLLASTRYVNSSYSSALIPVPPLPGDALFRLTEWFPALRGLSVANRARLAARLAGHPRAVEYANDLVGHSLAGWEKAHGKWTSSHPPTRNETRREWSEIVGPALPQVEQCLRDDLLLDKIWQCVLDDRARRMLARMTVLRCQRRFETAGFRRSGKAN